MDDAAAEPFDDALPVRVGPEELVDDRYLLDAFLENTPDHVYFKDHESRFIRISRALATWLGLEDAAEAIGRSDFDFFGEEHARKAFADEQHLMGCGEPLIGVEELETWADGHETWVSTTKVPLGDRRGRIVGVFGLSGARSRPSARRRSSVRGATALRSHSSFSISTISSRSTTRSATVRATRCYRRFPA